MMLHAIPQRQHERPGVGITMFGVTTPCVEQLVRSLTPQYECLVFHATGTGGQSMEKLLDDANISGVLDITTTEVCDYLFGGILACTSDRFGAVARSRSPYVGSCGALDMVNFGEPETVPQKYRGRKLYAHNPQITLMRTTVEENIQQARWIAARLNQCEGEVRFLVPMGGVSALDAPGQPSGILPQIPGCSIPACRVAADRSPEVGAFPLPYQRPGVRAGGSGRVSSDCQSMSGTD
jgi:uncharacterized protein (UPF0261 family)